MFVNSIFIESCFILRFSFFYTEYFRCYSLIIKSVYGKQCTFTVIFYFLNVHSSNFYWVFDLLDLMISNICRNRSLQLQMAGFHRRNLNALCVKKCPQDKLSNASSVQICFCESCINSIVLCCSMCRANPFTTRYSTTMSRLVCRVSKRYAYLFPLKLFVYNTYFCNWFITKERRKSYNF